MTEETLRIKNLHKSFGSLEVLKGVDIAVKKGEVVVILGCSGSGKSTLLRCVNLIEVPDRGNMHFRDSDKGFDYELNFDRLDVKPSTLQKLRTDIGMVFQSFNLWPHKTVKENVTLGLIRSLGMSTVEANERCMRELKKGRA